MSTPVGQGTLVARSLITCTTFHIPISAVIYAFTMGATRDTIDAAVLNGHVFLPAEVYIRTKYDLLCLVHFKSLAALQRAIPGSFARLHRGVLGNLSFLLNVPTIRGDHSIGFWLRDPRDLKQKDCIRLSPDGQRVVDSLVLNPSDSSDDTDLVPPDADKTPPDDRVSPAD